MQEIALIISKCHEECFCPVYVFVAIYYPPTAAWVAIGLLCGEEMRF